MLYTTGQLNLTKHMWPCTTQHDTCFVSLMYIHVCVSKIDDIESLCRALMYAKICAQ